jgi:hypothetical protein
MLPVEVESGLSNLDPQSFAVSDGTCMFRTNAVFIKQSPRRMCAMDACHSAIGQELVRSVNVKRAQVRRIGEERAAVEDCAVADVVEASMPEQPPFEFHRDRTVRKWSDVIARESGIRVCRMHFVDKMTGKGDKHFIVVDSWRQIIIDNGAVFPIPFAGRTHKQLLRRISCAGLECAWLCRVYASRLRQTKFV